MSDSSNELAITIEAVSKYFDIGQTHSYQTLRDTITTKVKLAVKAVSRKNVQATNSQIDYGFWALKNINLDIYKGEKIGILGSNGAGKSTLAKIISRVTKPTEGKVTGYGSVASLLEVGAGFHPELTGRENIYLNGAIMGMSRKEIARKFNEIVEFSEVEKFLDMPVKRYSSGMYVKLAFSVAVHLDSEVIVIDEVLSVGDAKFQKKCLAKMEETTRGNRTVIFISHNMSALQNLCTRAVHIEKGEIIADGDPSQVIAGYLQIGGDVKHRNWTGDDRPGSSHIKLNRVSIFAEGGSLGDAIYLSDNVKLEIEYENVIGEGFLDLNILLLNEHGILVWDLSRSENKGDKNLVCKGVLVDTFTIPANLLNDGQYSIDLKAFTNQQIVYTHSNLINFSLVDDDERRDGWYGHWAGVIRPKLAWNTRLLTKL